MSMSQIPLTCRNGQQGLSGSIRKVDEDWIAESQMGTVKVRFVEKNKFGILDHDVMLPSGENIYNPMRVFPNNDGSELVFTLYQRLGMSDQMFDEDAEIVRQDLERLKNVLEKSSYDEKEIDQAVNTIQSLIAVKDNGIWFISLFQNTPAQLHGRPELTEALTEELQHEVQKWEK